MKLKIEIRHNATGVIAVDREDVEDDCETPIYGWTDGNFSCDCNRAIVWTGHSGTELPDEEYECSEGRFSIRITDDAGAVLFDEIGPVFVGKRPLVLSKVTEVIHE